MLTSFGLLKSKQKTKNYSQLCTYQTTRLDFTCRLYAALFFLSIFSEVFHSFFQNVVCSERKTRKTENAIHPFSCAELRSDRTHEHTCQQHRETQQKIENMYCLLIPSQNRAAFAPLVSMIQSSSDYGNLRVIEDVPAVPTAQQWIEWNIDSGSTIVLGLSATEKIYMGYVDASYCQLIDDARRLTNDQVYALVFDSNAELAARRVDELYSHTNASPQFQWLIGSGRLLIRQSTALSQNSSLATMFTVANHQKPMVRDKRLVKLAMVIVVIVMLWILYDFLWPRAFSTDLRERNRLRLHAPMSVIGGAV